VVGELGKWLSVQDGLEEISQIEVGKEKLRVRGQKLKNKMLNIKIVSKV
jgi:hypothetical protein